MERGEESRSASATASAADATASRCCLAAGSSAILEGAAIAPCHGCCNPAIANSEAECLLEKICGTTAPDAIIEEVSALISSTASG